MHSLQDDPTVMASSCEKALEDLSKEELMAAHMQRVYQAYYDPPRDYRSYLLSQEQEHADARHMVRTLVGARYHAGPSAIARAESLLRQKLGKMRGPNHSTIIHSKEIFMFVLQVHRPGLTRCIEQIIENTALSEE